MTAFEIDGPHLPGKADVQEAAGGRERGTGLEARRVTQCSIQEGPQPAHGDGREQARHGDRGVDRGREGPRLVDLGAQPASVPGAHGVRAGTLLESRRQV